MGHRGSGAKQMSQSTSPRGAVVGLRPKRPEHKPERGDSRSEIKRSRTKERSDAVGLSRRAQLEKRGGGQEG